MDLSAGWATGGVASALVTTGQLYSPPKIGCESTEGILQFSATPAWAVQQQTYSWFDSEQISISLGLMILQHDQDGSLLPGLLPAGVPQAGILNSNVLVLTEFPLPIPNMSGNAYLPTTHKDPALSGVAPLFVQVPASSGHNYSCLVFCSGHVAGDGDGGGAASWASLNVTVQVPFLSLFLQN